MSEASMFRLEDFPGTLTKITVTDEGDTKKGKAIFEFEDAEWVVKVTVQPRFDDLLKQFFVKMPYKMTLKPATRTLKEFQEEEHE